MIDEEKRAELSEASLTEQSNNALVVKTADLNKESLEIINKVIEEKDIDKTNDLTQLFNINQRKKTMVRINKINELQDILVDQAIDRFTKKPDEIDNNTLIQALKTTQDMAERSQKMINDQATNTPLIQINQQTNELNVGVAGQLPTKESRDRVKNAVASILAGVNAVKQAVPDQENIIEVEAEESEDVKND